MVTQIKFLKLIIRVQKKYHNPKDNGKRKDITEDVSNSIALDAFEKMTLSDGEYPIILHAYLFIYLEIGINQYPGLKWLWSNYGGWLISFHKANYT